MRSFAGIFLSWQARRFRLHLAAGVWRISWPLGASHQGQPRQQSELARSPERFCDEGLCR